MWAGAFSLNSQMRYVPKFTNVQIHRLAQLMKSTSIKLSNCISSSMYYFSFYNDNERLFYAKMKTSVD